MRIVFCRGRQAARKSARSLGVAAAAGVVIGALGAYFLAPSGRARRRLTRDRTAGRIRRGRRRLLRVFRVRLAFLRGRALRITHRLRSTQRVDFDDATLGHKVESVLFRDPKVPKGRINVNAERGTVFLRGEVDDDELIRSLGRAVGEIQGVRAVENLLHPPGKPAPHTAPSRPE
jgi:hypothetical protein